jgi:membrane protein insertase Oxa1/YidC/SpoIIIJ
MLWSNLIDVIRGSLFVLAHWCGGSFGAAILLASATTRIALLPLTFSATRRRLAQEQKMRDLAPALGEIKRRHKSSPDLVVSKTRELYAANGIAQLDGKAFASSLIQWPPAAALYSAIRGTGASTGGFLWISNLAKPDRLLVIVASLVAGGAAWLAAAGVTAKGAAPIFSVMLSMALALLFLSHLSAGIALYSIANSVVGVVERALAVRANKLAAQ